MGDVAEAFCFGRARLNTPMYMYTPHRVVVAVMVPSYRVEELSSSLVVSGFSPPFNLLGIRICHDKSSTFSFAGSVELSAIAVAAYSLFTY